MRCDVAGVIEASWERDRFAFILLPSCYEVEKSVPIKFEFKLALLFRVEITHLFEFSFYSCPHAPHAGHRG